MPQSKCRRSSKGCTTDQTECLPDADGTPRCRRRSAESKRKSSRRRGSRRASYKRKSSGRSGSRRRSYKRKSSRRSGSRRHGYNYNGAAAGRAVGVPNLRQPFLQYSDAEAARKILHRKRSRKSSKSRRSQKRRLTESQAWIDSMYNKGVNGLKKFPDFSKLPRYANEADRKAFVDMEANARTIYNLIQNDNSFNTRLLNQFESTVMNAFANEPATVRKHASTIVFLLGRKMIGQDRLGQGQQYNAAGQRAFFNQYYAPRAAAPAARAAPWNLKNFGGQLEGF